MGVECFPFHLGFHLARLLLSDDVGIFGTPGCVSLLFNFRDIWALAPTLLGALLELVPF